MKVFDYKCEFAHTTNSDIFITDMVFPASVLYSPFSATRLSHCTALSLAPPPSIRMIMRTSGMASKALRYTYGNFSSTLPEDCCHLHSLGFHQSFHHLLIWRSGEYAAISSLTKPRLSPSHDILRRTSILSIQTI